MVVNDRFSQINEDQQGNSVKQDFVSVKRKRSIDNPECFNGKE
jgi:hypothetical protein